MTVAVADPTTTYAEAVASGEIIAGPHVRAACERHLRDLETGADRGLRWNPDAAERVMEFFPTVLRLAGGKHEGKPFRLLGWEQFVIGSLFGWQEWSDEHQGWFRRHRMAYVETGKGSGKSPIAAGIGMYMMTADDEPRAEAYAAATKKDQAKVLFRDAVAMVEQSPSLSSRVKISGAKGAEHNLAYAATGSFFRPISTEDRGRGQSGPRPHYAALDEVHEHRTNAMVEYMKAGQKDRRQPLVFMITNSGVDRTTVCYDYHDYGAKVAAGEIEDDSFFAYICSVDEGEDPLQDEDDPELGYPRSWLKTNPSLPHGLPGVKYLRDQVSQAKGMPAKESIVRRLNFCQWVDAASPWISGDRWRACEVEDLTLPDRPVFGALDLSGKLDLTALALVAPDGDGGYDAEVRFWTPGDTLQDRELADRVPYWAWTEQGHLNAPPGQSIDYAVPAGVVAELHAAGQLRALAFDPYRIADFLRELDRVGVASWVGVRDTDALGRVRWVEDGKKRPGEGLMLVGHGQGFGGGASDRSLWMPRSIEALEAAVLDTRLRIRKNPVLTWNSASAVIEMDAQGNKKFTKRKSTGRIDGLVALCMALGAAQEIAEILETTTPRGWLL